MSQDKTFRSNLLQHMASLFGRPISSDWLRTFLASVQDLTDAQLAAGVKAAIEEQDFLPTPAQVRRGCKGMVTSKKAQAWQRGANRQVREAAERHGRTIEEEIAHRQRPQPMKPTEMSYHDTLERFGQEQAERELDDAVQAMLAKLRRRSIVKKAQEVTR